MPSVCLVLCLQLVVYLIPSLRLCTNASPRSHTDTTSAIVLQGRGLCQNLHKAARPDVISDMSELSQGSLQ